MDRSCTLNASKINVLRQSVNVHNKNVSKILLASKETLEKRMQIESAFRACKEAFLELSITYLTLLESRMSAPTVSDEIKSLVCGAVTEACDSLLARTSLCNSGLVSRESLSQGAHIAPSYASVLNTGQSTVCVARGPTLDIAKTTNLIITPEDENVRLTSSRDTRNAVQKVLNPSDFNFKVKTISSVKNNGVRIEVQTVDFDRMKNSRLLEKAGLRVEQESKVNPRLLVRGVPCNLTRDDLKSEIITLKDMSQADTLQVKIVYIYPPRENRKTTNCVIEVSPNIRTLLLREKHVFVNYFACKVSDHIKVLQCFKCLAFGHFAKNCRFSSLCDHCAEVHEIKDCGKKNAAPVCGNCKKWMSHENPAHSALNGNNCPILRKRLADKINSINYG